MADPRLTGDVKHAPHDAHLIAAAPELYEALEDALAVLRVYQNDGAVVSHRGQGIGVICDEALALARGEVKP